MTRLIFLAVFLFSVLLGEAQTELKPFASHNQSPLIHSFGLPDTEGGFVVGKGKFSFSSDLEISSNSTNAKTGSEVVYFDGEMTCLDLKVRYGLGSGFEIGVKIPVVNHSRGFMDNSIDGFHDLLGLTGGARGKTPQGDMHYSYLQDDQFLFSFSESSLGVGDINLELGYRLVEKERHALALRAYLKLNNADKRKLLGSGTVDFSLQLAGQNEGRGVRPATFFYSMGYLRVGDGALLESMQIHNIGFGSIGLAVQSNSWFVPKFQFNYHSKFYKESNTRELGSYSLQFLLGADFLLKPNCTLSAGIIEDVKVNTAPDFVFHLGLNYSF